LKLLLIAAASFGLGLVLPGPGRSREALASACVRDKNAASCEELASALERGALPSRFPEEPGLYWSLACEAARTHACARAADWAKRYSDYETMEVDAGCMLQSSGFACEEVASALRDESEERARSTGLKDLARRRMKRALELYSQRCAADDAPACLGASRVYDGGFGVPWTPSLARETEAKACALGLTQACLLEGERSSDADAIPLYQKACELSPSSPHACLKLARAYEKTGAPASVVERSYRHACDLLAEDACDWLHR
jgi:TPR repeat protein